MRPKPKIRYPFKLDRMTAEQRREVEDMFAHGVPYRLMAKHIRDRFGLAVGESSVRRFCYERIQREATRAARLQEQAETIARALLTCTSTDATNKTRAALHTVFFNLLNDAKDESLTDVARELRELEKVDVARERVAVEQKKVQISQKQLELKNRELEARLAAGREALAQVEQAVTRGHSTLPADVLAKLKEAYGIN